MNPKFKKLALEAGGCTYPEVNSAQLQKFAELIVLESAKLLTNNGYTEGADLLTNHWNGNINLDFDRDFGVN